MIKNLQRYLQENINRFLNDPCFMHNLAYTLGIGRDEFHHRAAWVCHDINDVIIKLNSEGTEEQLEKESALENNTEILYYYDLAKKWLKRESVDWNILYPTGSAYRIPLPTYEFLKTPYWISHNEMAFIPVDNTFSSLPKEKKLIAEKLSHLWIKILGLTHIQYHQDFNNLGGDSMFALQLLSQIEAIFGVRLDLDDVMKQNTILTMSDLILHTIKHGNEPQPFLIPLTQYINKPPIIFIHPGNGTLFSYYPLKDLLENDLAIWGIQKQVYHDLKIPFSSIQDMAAHYVSLLEKENRIHEPYVLAGWSLGGVVAFEMAVQLRKKNKQVKKLFLFDSWAFLDKNFLKKEYFHKMYIGRQDIYENLQDIQLWEELLWKRISLLVNYEPSFLNNVEVILFKANNVLPEYARINEVYSGWEKFCRLIKLIDIPGDHHSIMNQDNLGRISTYIKAEFSLR